MIEYFLFIFFLNRLLFAYQIFFQKSEELKNDFYFLNLCDAADFKELGRHSSICSSIEISSKTGILSKVLQDTIDDTLYNCLNIQQIISLSAMFIAVVMLQSIHKRYVKTKNNFLPINNNQKLHCD